MKKYLLLFSVVVLAFSACKKVDVDAEQAAYDEAKIQAYISANNITGLTKDPSGVYYRIEKTGDGPSIKETSTVKVSFKGTLLNGSGFDQSLGFTIKLANAIKGWQIGLVKINGPTAVNQGDGGKIYMIVPPALGYGATASGSIPANSVLVFDVTIIGAGD